MAVKVGPLDPDAGERFGHVSKGPTARQLLRIHAQMHPLELRTALGRKLDAERTKGLDLEEVRSHLGGLERENGDPVVPKGSTVVGAQVRGERDTDQLLTFTYRTPSGRTGKWFTPLDRDALPESTSAGDELVRTTDLRERGIVAFDSEATQTEIYRRELSRLRRENDALRKFREGRLGDEDVELGENDERVDDRPDNAIVGEVEQLRRERQALIERVQQLEASRADEATAALRGDDPDESDEAEGGTPSGEEPEPIENYDELHAPVVVARLRAPDTDDETRQRILDYERAHANRRSVIGAAEESLGTRGEG